MKLETPDVRLIRIGIAVLLLRLLVIAFILGFKYCATLGA